MNLLLDNTYLKVRVVYHCMIKSTPKREVTKMPFWSLEKDKVKEIPSWTLEIDYLGEDTRRYTYTSKSDDHSALKDQFDDIMKQIKDQDSQYADKLLEEAIISGGNK